MNDGFCFELTSLNKKSYYLFILFYIILLSLESSRKKKHQGTYQYCNKYIPVYVYHLSVIIKFWTALQFITIIHILTPFFPDDFLMISNQEHTTRVIVPALQVANSAHMLQLVRSQKGEHFMTKQHCTLKDHQIIAKMFRNK